MNKMNFAAGFVALALPVFLISLAGCKSPHNQIIPQTAGDVIFTNDVQETPSAIQKELGVGKLSQADLDKINKDHYNKGCKVAGQPEPILQLDPKLAAGDTFVIEEDKSASSIPYSASVAPNTFRGKFDLSLASFPASGSNAPLNFQGTLESAEISNFSGAVLNHDNAVISKKCAVLDASTNLEKCYPIEVDYTKEFAAAFNQSFDVDLSCELNPTNGRNTKVHQQDSWSTGIYTMENGKQVNVYIHRLQSTSKSSPCGQNIPAQTLVRTQVTATSNDVVANRYLHCGGEVMFSKTTLRDGTSGAIISQNAYSLLLAPIK